MASNSTASSTSQPAPPSWRTPSTIPTGGDRDRAGPVYSHPEQAYTPVGEASSFSTRHSQDRDRYPTPSPVPPPTPYFASIAPENLRPSTMPRYSSTTAPDPRLSTPPTENGSTPRESSSQRLSTREVHPQHTDNVSLVPRARHHGVVGHYPITYPPQPARASSLRTPRGPPFASFASSAYTPYVNLPPQQAVDVGVHAHAFNPMWSPRPAPPRELWPHVECSCHETCPAHPRCDVHGPKQPQRGAYCACAHP